MPKQNLILNDFSGGMNKEVNAEDIDDNQFETLIDADITKKGSIRLVGKGSRYTDITAKSVGVMAGFGLFSFSSDYSFVGSPVEGSYECLVLHDYNNYHIWNGTSWISQDKFSRTLELGSTATPYVEPSHYYVDGALRMSDPDNATNTNTWLGYVKISQFGSGTEGWIQEDQAIIPPTAGIVGDLEFSATGTASSIALYESGGFFEKYEGWLEDTQMAVTITDDEAGQIESYISTTELKTATIAPDTWAGDKVILFPYVGCGFNVDFDTDNGGSWEAGEYETACTFIYEGDQESLPFLMGGTFTTIDGDKLDCRVYATGEYNPRIRGGRIYYRVSGSNGEWILLADIDLENGVRSTISGDYAEWNDPVGWIGTEDIYYALLKSEYMNVETYEMLTGVNQDEDSIYAEFKTASIANRRAYIGNVKIDGVKYGDRILRSPVGKFDIFPSSSVLDVAIGDGDEIIHLETTGDKILVFKKHKLYVINVSQEYEFIESEFAHRGVDYSCSVCNTPYGVCFTNTFGIFIYDGTKVVELSKEIATSFNSFYDIDWRPAIGYDPSSDSLIVIDGAGSSGTKDTYLFSFKTSSWLYIDSMFPDALQTNFVEYDGKLIAHNFYSSGGIYSYDKDPVATTKFYAKTKNFDFGDPFREKKIYEVFVKHAGNNTPNINVILTDGISTTNIGTLTHAFLTYNTLDKFTYSGAPLNHAQLKLTASGTVPSEFMIDAIGITYRMKGVSKNV